MAATCSVGAVSGGKAPVTGSGIVGAEAVITASFASTDGKRRYIESYRVPAVVGAASYDVPVPFSSGTVAVKVFDLAGTLLATASTLNV